MSRAAWRLGWPGLLWGLWTTGLPLLVLQLSRRGWFFVASGLQPLEPGNGQVLLDGIAARLHLPVDVLPAALLASGCIAGLVLTGLLALLDPHRLALSSLAWTARSWRAHAAALWMLAMTWGWLALGGTDGLWLIGWMVMLSWIAGANVLSWLVFHPRVVEPDRAGPMFPLARASRRVVGRWVLLVLAGKLLSWGPRWWRDPFAAVLQSLEAHWLLRRDRTLSLRSLARALLHLRLLAPWLAIPLWAIAALSLLIGPVLASSYFCIVEVPALQDVVNRAGGELPWALRAWTDASRVAVRYGWMIAGCLASAAVGWWVFAEGRLAHLQRHDVDARLAEGLRSASPEGPAPAGAVTSP